MSSQQTIKDIDNFVERRHSHFVPLDDVVGGQILSKRPSFTGTAQKASRGQSFVASPIDHSTPEPRWSIVSDVEDRERNITNQQTLLKSQPAKSSLNFSDRASFSFPKHSSFGNAHELFLQDLENGLIMDTDMVLSPSQKVKVGPIYNHAHVSHTIILFCSNNQEPSIKKGNGSLGVIHILSLTTTLLTVKRFITLYFA